MQKKSASNPEFMIGEQNNMVFASSVIKSGSCLAIVAGLGDDCEVAKGGKIERGYDVDSLFCLRSIDRFSSFVSVFAFVISAIAILCAFLYKKSLSEIIETGYASIAFSSTILTEFFFVFTRAMIASRLNSSGDNSGEKGAIITNPTSIESLSDIDCIAINADSFFDDREIEIISFAYSGNIYPADEACIDDDASLFLRCVSVAESASEYYLKKKSTKGLEISPFSRAAYEFSIERAGESRFKLGYKRGMSFDFPYELSIILGREKFALIRGDFEDILSHSESVIYGKRAKLMDHKDKAYLRTVANRYISEGYNVCAYARRVYTGEEIASESFRIAGLQFYGIFAYKYKLRADAQEFFSHCLENSLRPVIFADKAKYMIRELKGGCSALDGTRFCIGSMLKNEQSLREAGETYDFFLDLSEEQKAILLNSLRENGYRICMCTDKFSDFSLISPKDMTVTSPDSYDMGTVEIERRKFGDRVKSGALSENADALTDGAMGLLGAVKAAKRLYRQLHLCLEYLTGLFVARSIVFLVLALFGINIFTPTQMLTLNLYSDLLGVLCIAFSCKRVISQSDSHLSLDFYKSALISRYASFAFSGAILLLVLLSHTFVIPMSEQILYSTVFTAFVLLSPVSLICLSRDLWNRTVVMYLFGGMLLILVGGAVNPINVSLGITGFGSSMIISLAPIAVYVAASLIYSIVKHHSDEEGGK